MEFYIGTKEERLPGFTADFPYIASVKKAPGKKIFDLSPWHWHKSVELFTIEEGALEYNTPGGKLLFPAGSGGLVNSNIIHMTVMREGPCVQRLHIFDPAFLAGEQGRRVERAYITPLTAAAHVEIVGFFPERGPDQAETVRMIKEGFRLKPGEFGYELRLRALLSEIWLRVLEQARPALESGGPGRGDNEKIKLMMIYIREHFAQRITIAQLAAAGYLSGRGCYRVFQEYLHTTPVEYMRGYRLRAACQMLANTGEPITEVAQACGLGSSSYFGKLFRAYAHCTPSEYRTKWQDRNR